MAERPNHHYFLGKLEAADSVDLRKMPNHHSCGGRKAAHNSGGLTKTAKPPPLWQRKSSGDSAKMAKPPFLRRANWRLRIVLVWRKRPNTTPLAAKLQWRWRIENCNIKQESKMIMIGAIIGDIVGSRFEFQPIKTKDFFLFTPDSDYTDDSLMTIAVGMALDEAIERGKG